MFDPIDAAFALIGFGMFLAAILPRLVAHRAISMPIVFLGLGVLVHLLPIGLVNPDPRVHPNVAKHLAEVVVIIALMGAGLRLDRPFGRIRWSSTWRLLAITMPLSIVATAFLGWWVLGLGPAAALLLGSVLAPTDPVLASDVQVGEPSEDEESEDEVRFALTSEAGLNDGLAFPFTYAAIALAGAGSVAEWGLEWFAWELVGKVVLGAAVGTAVGWALAKLAFRAPMPSLRLAETGEPLLALAAVLLSYGATEVVHGYGFLAVFACAMTLRSAERGHEYHVHMHESIERLERLLTLVVLLLLGVSLNDTIRDLTVPGALVGVALIFVVRPLSGFVSLKLGKGRDRVGDQALNPAERRATAFFGVRGVGSIYYLAYAAGEAEFGHLDELWATVTFTIGLSVLVHGVAATPLMNRLERAGAEA